MRTGTGDSAKEERLRFGSVHQIPVLMRNQAHHRMRPGVGRVARQFRRHVNALFGDIGDQRAFRRSERRGEAQQFDLFPGFEQRAFAGQRADYEPGHRRAAPFVEVMLDLDAADRARVIERRRRRRKHSL